MVTDNRTPELRTKRMLTVAAKSCQLRIELPDGSYLLLQHLSITGDTVRVHVDYPFGSTLETEPLPPKRDCLAAVRHRS